MVNKATLTSRQEHFALLLFQGYNQTDAYRLAYPGQAKTKSRVLWVKASQLAHKGKVMVRVAELRAMALAPAIADVIARKEHASAVMWDQEAKHRDQLAANKLLGEYEGDFVVRTENINQSLNANIDLSEFSLDDLRLMLAEAKRREALEAGGSSTPDR
jgi:DNA-binding transcriptional regulator YdaS (Cro superfamily)